MGCSNNSNVQEKTYAKANIKDNDISKENQIQKYGNNSSNDSNSSENKNKNKNRSKNNENESESLNYSDINSKLYYLFFILIQR
jgi:hypothetical protein